MDPLTLIGGALAGFAAFVAGTWKQRQEEQLRRLELRRRHQTAMRIDRIRRRAEDEMLTAGGVIDGEATEEPR
jgi:hypothetical protein